MNISCNDLKCETLSSGSNSGNAVAWGDNGFFNSVGSYNVNVSNASYTKVSTQSNVTNGSGNLNIIPTGLSPVVSGRYLIEAHFNSSSAAPDNIALGIGVNGFVGFQGAVVFNNSVQTQLSLSEIRPVNAGQPVEIFCKMNTAPSINTIFEWTLTMTRVA
jgi:hypothetical protein